MNKDITWCASPDCVLKCDRHITRCDARQGDYVSVSDMSGICRTYIGQVFGEKTMIIKTPKPKFMEGDDDDV